MVTILIAGCSNETTVDEDNDKRGDIVYSYRTAYIGDNAKVAQIVDIFYGPYESIALQTNQAPYELNIYLEELPTDESEMNYKNSLILSLIKNAGIVTIHAEDQTFSTVREDVESILKYDPIEVHDNEELFIELYEKI